MTFAPEYVSSALNDIFEDGTALLLEPRLAIHREHLVRLVDRRIVSAEDDRAIRQALQTLKPDALRASTRLLEEDRAWMDGRRVALSEAARHLEERVCTL